MINVDAYLTHELERVAASPATPPDVVTVLKAEIERRGPLEKRPHEGASTATPPDVAAMPKAETVRRGPLEQRHRVAASPPTPKAEIAQRTSSSATPADVDTIVKADIERHASLERLRVAASEAPSPDVAPMPQLERPPVARSPEGGEPRGT
jgi:pyocin large subunit-like protein